MKIKIFEAWTDFTHAVSVYDTDDVTLVNLRLWCGANVDRDSCVMSSRQFYFKEESDRTMFLLKVNSIAQ